MQDKLFALTAEGLHYVDTSISTGTISFDFLSNAPFLIKLISNGRYCAYRTTVYVPIDHLTLVSSEHPSDRLVATSKVLPWVIAMRDGHLASYFNVWKFLHDYRLVCKYFLYEFGLLKSNNHPQADIIYGGFVVSRKTFWGRLIDPDVVVAQLRSSIKEKAL